MAVLPRYRNLKRGVPASVSKVGYAAKVQMFELEEKQPLKTATPSEQFFPNEAN